MINLNDYALDTKEAEIAYPGIESFRVRVNYVGKAVAAKIMEESNIPVIVNGTIANYKTDDTKFIQQLAKNCINGWTGLTVGVVDTLMLTTLVDKGVDSDELVEFNEENAIALLTHSKAFLDFITANIYNLDSFRTKKA